jgi:hypothetical protein
MSCSSIGACLSQRKCVSNHGHQRHMASLEFTLRGRSESHDRLGDHMATPEPVAKGGSESHHTG